ncbi:MAG: DNA alkylation repair protein [Flavobacteriales bacterium]|nr:DNA alkylation repair protein [Flavobacteriales bacterium]
MTKNTYATVLIDLFSAHGDPAIAEQQKAYMRNQFDYFGLKSEKRKTLQKEAIAIANKPKKEDLEDQIKLLWENPHRECQYAAQELFVKYVRHLEEADLDLIEWMIVTKSWWDTIDYIAANLVGKYYLKYPDLAYSRFDEWLDSDNFWLQRCVLLYPLKFKGELDWDLLSRCVHHLEGSNEFFINKAIGWILRQSSRHQPDKVREFIQNHQLSKLSLKEATKYI